MLQSEAAILDGLQQAIGLAKHIVRVVRITHHERNDKTFAGLGSSIYGGG